MKIKQMKIVLAIVGVLGLALCGYSTVLYTDNFSSYAIGSTPPATVVSNTTVKVIDGSATTGHGNAVQITDDSSVTGSVFVQQLAGATNAASSYGAIRYSFDIYNNQLANSTGLFLAVVGTYNGTMSSLGSQYLALQFSTTNNSLRLSGKTTITTNYNLGTSNHIDIFVNDSNSSGVSYWGGTLATNSYAVYLDGTQLAVQGMTTNLSPGTSNGLGRVGFYSATTAIGAFTVDNILVTTDLSVPEPTTISLITLSTFSLLVWRRFRP